MQLIKSKNNYMYLNKNNLMKINNNLSLRGDWMTIKKMKIIVT